MNHILRAAFVSTALFTCSACATTGTLGPNFAEAIEPETGTARFDHTPQPAATATAPDPASHAFRQWQDQPRPTIAGSRTGWLRYEQRLMSWLREGVARIYPAATWEPTNSRLRIVLNLIDRTPGEAGSSVAWDDVAVADASVWPGGSAAFGESTPDGWVPEVLGVNREKVELGGADGDGSGAFDLWPPAVEPLNTPEPGTLALAGLGVIGLGIVQRIRRAS
jgi:hypothetical protein